MRRMAAVTVSLALSMLGLPSNVGSSFGQVATATGTTIEFLNPSAYAPAGEFGILVSDKQTTRPSTGDTTYRLSAWVAGVPLNATVEFELLRNALSLQTIDATRQVGSDTWEADWDIGNMLAPGAYILRATVASGGLEVATTDQPITLNTLAERAEIDYPRAEANKEYPGGSQFGTFARLAGSADASRPGPVGNIDGKNSGTSSGTGTSRVRAFYTTSAPGSVPVWTACGTENAPGDALLSGAANDGVRCTLGGGYEQTQVTAVALVANTSNRGEYDARLNGAGDAVRVLQPYAQVPSDLKFTEGGVGQIDAGVNGSFACHSAYTMLKDQYGREIVGANIDIEAIGPSDSLKFDTGLLPVYGEQAPDEGGFRTELGYDCFGDDSENIPLEQGERQVIGGPDLKHLEADGDGTDDTGAWGFSLRIPGSDVTDSRFTTYFSAWVDEVDPGTETNDDAFTTSEPCVGGAVGWGAFPANPETDVTLLPCQPPPLCPPSPSATATPSSECGPQEPPVQTASLTLKGRIAKGEGTFNGKLISDDVACATARVVHLKLRSNGRFVKQSSAYTDADGLWRIRIPFASRGLYKAVAPAGNTCTKVASRKIRL